MEFDDIPDVKKAQKIHFQNKICAYIQTHFNQMACMDTCSTCIEIGKTEEGGVGVYGHIPDAD